MKLTKAETKKALYSLLGVVAFVVLASALVLSPIQSKRTAAKAELSSLTEQLATAEQKVKAGEREELILRQEGASMAILEEGQPLGIHLDWVPAHVTEFFHFYDVEVGKVKVSGTWGNPSEGDRIWSTVEVSSTSYRNLRRAIAALKYPWPTVEVTGLEFMGNWDWDDNTPASAKLTLSLWAGTLPVADWIEVPSDSRIPSTRVKFTYIPGN